MQNTGKSRARAVDFYRGRTLMTTRAKLFPTLIIFGLLFLARGASAATYYVDAASPDDSRTGTSWATAKKTIAAGIGLITAKGDVLRIKSGTYTAGMNITSRVNGTGWTTGNYITVRSDDGAGNYGNVVVQGTVNDRFGSTVALLKDTNYWRFEYLTFTASGQNAAFIADGPDSSPYRNGVYLYHCTLNGTPTEYVVHTSGYNYVYMDGNTVAGTSTVSEATIHLVGDSQVDPPRDWPNYYYVFNNTFRGNSSGGYGLLTIKRSNNTYVYNNYFDQIIQPAFTHRHGNYSHVYNNTVKLGSGFNRAFVMEMRGMTTGAQNGPGSVHWGYYYNNTIDLNGKTPEAVFLHINDTQNSYIENNLIIGNVTYLLTSYTDSTYGNRCSSTGEVSSGNFIRNNVTTGSVKADMYSQITGWTSVNNRKNQSQVLVQRSGSVPSPYYHLSVNADGGAPFTALGVDYDGFARAATPDVGAFEFNGAGPTPPAAPVGLIIQSY